MVLCSIQLKVIFKYVRPDEAAQDRFVKSGLRGWMALPTSTPADIADCQDCPPGDPLEPPVVGVCSAVIRDVPSGVACQAEWSAYSGPADVPLMSLTGRPHPTRVDILICRTSGPDPL